MATLKEAIKAKDESAVAAAVEKAVKVHIKNVTKAVENEEGACVTAKPEEAVLETAFGDVPFSLVFDEDTKWQQVTAAYVEVVNAVSRMPKDATKDEVQAGTARLIASNAVLRSVGATSSVDNDLL